MPTTILPQARRQVARGEVAGGAAVLCFGAVRDDALRRHVALARRHAMALVRALANVLWLLVLAGAAALVDAAATARALGPRETARRAGWLLLRAAGFALASLAAFVVVGAFVAAHVAGGYTRAFVVALVVVALPLGLRWCLRAQLGRGVATGCNGALVLLLLVGYGRDAGAVLRRHGDWFLGWRDDASARSERAGITETGWLIERFAAPPEMVTHELPPEATPPFYGPWRPGERPDPTGPVFVHWFAPLGGARALPELESRRFGAARPQPRPAECELGHCGVDFGAPLGTPVFAIADGVVERVERDAAAGGRAGRFVRLAHLDGRWVSRYIHLSSIRHDLRPGVHVVAGELVGTVGRSGVEENFPHLHFALSRRSGAGAEIYVDPEPFLRVWELRRTLLY